MHLKVISHLILQYARYLDGTGESARALRVLHRAAGIHLPNSPTIHLAYSALEEKYGNYESASNILADFDHRHPGYAIIALRRIGIDRRFAQKHAGDKEGSDYSDVISRFERLIHNPQTPRRLSSFYALKLARFHLKVRNDRRLCEKIVRDALNRDKDNTQLFLMLVDLAFTSPSYKESDVIAALDFALASEDLSDEDKLKFSQRKLDFLEDLGSDISELQDHLEFHAKLQESIGCGQSTPKRKTDMSPLGEPLDKRSRSTSYIAPQILPQQQLPAYGTVAPAYQFSPTVIPYYYSSQQTLQQTTQTSSTIPQLQQTY
ncbi:hypothetical protein AB6A40_004963 [Gnathostoma spinigerum]|uniref:Uncharacterized protein n=1 Tax=Gnathostoma spinigerum TaxID=75299 RepID=A0ABD6EE24_9BILA